MSVQVKRVYDEPAKSDGYRVLVDRLWPRGLKKSDAQLKEIAPARRCENRLGTTQVDGRSSKRNIGQSSTITVTKLRNWHGKPEGGG